MACCCLGRGHVGNCAHSKHGESGGDFANHLVGFGVLGQSDQRAAAAENTGLFTGDFADGIAKPLHVIERDVGDDRKQRIDDIGRIEPSTQAHFKNRDFNGWFGEAQKCHRGKGLEETGRLRQLLFFHQLLPGGADAEKEPGEVRRR